GHPIDPTNLTMISWYAHNDPRDRWFRPQGGTPPPTHVCSDSCNVVGRTLLADGTGAITIARGLTARTLAEPRLRDTHEFFECYLADAVAERGQSVACE